MEMVIGILLVVLSAAIIALVVQTVGANTRSQARLDAPGSTA